MRLVWRNGSLIDRDQAVLSVYSPAANYSHAIFDNCHVFVGGGRRGQAPWIVGLESHLDRFARSCTGLRLNLTYSAAELRAAVFEVVTRNAPAERCAIRLFAFNGEGEYGSSDPASVVVFMRSLKGYALTRPYRLAVSRIVRTAHAVPAYWVKAMAHYATGRLATLEARDTGFDEAIFLNDYGGITETPRANIVVLRDGVATTPPPEAGLLPGLTRDIVQRLCTRHGWRWEERPIRLAEIGPDDAAVLTSSSLGVAPVSQIGAIRFADLSPAQELVRLFDAMVQDGGSEVADLVDEVRPAEVR